MFPTLLSETPYLIEDYDVESCHRDGNKSAHRFVMDVASKAISLTPHTGVNKKAIAYPTPYNQDLTPEEQFTYVNPTVKLMGKVYSLSAP